MASGIAYLSSLLRFLSLQLIYGGSHTGRIKKRKREKKGK
jgi:hypothetical protein